MREKNRFLGLLIALVTTTALLVSAHFTHAQLTVTGTKSKISLKMNPAQPKPFDTVSFVVESFSTDLNRAKIEWFVGNKLVKSGKGEKEHELAVGGPGTKTEVRIVATTADIGVLRAAATIRPAQVDLIFEANTYTPPFYLGKALPTHHSGMSVVAIPHLQTGTGALFNEKDLIYTWKENGVVQGKKSGTGRNVYHIENISIMRGSSLLAVFVSSPDGTLNASETISIRPQTPKVVIYENHPLEGVRYNKAILQKYMLTEDEVTLQASPYFFGVLDKEDFQLKYTWRQNSQVIDAAELKQSGVTLRKGEESGVANVSLQVNHKINVLETAQQSFMIEFGDRVSEQRGTFFPSLP